MTDKKKTAYMITFIIIAAYFSMLENLIPRPFPWMKLGLANVATLISMNKFGGKFAFELVILRILISSFMIGMLFTPNFFISFCAGTVSVTVMILLFQLKKYFSTVAISAVGGFFHNVTQIMTAYLLFFRNISVTDKGMLFFILTFSGLGVLSGIII